MTLENGDTFFSRDREFYRSLFRLLLIVGLENVINYSVNMADNLMLGKYSQSAMSGATCVNQVFFLIQQLMLGFGEAVVVIGSQYWGQRRTGPICRVAGVGMKLTAVAAAVIFVLLTLLPAQILSLFTPDAEIIAQGVEYLKLIKYAFVIYMFSALLTSTLRSVETVRIAFIISIISLVLNVCINYALIFGRFGLPEMGVAGAAVGTLAARIVELLVLVYFVAFRDKKLKLFKSGWLRRDPELRRDYTRVMLPLMCSQLLWAVSVPMQTAILGKLSSDAIAANSVATTFYQYLKVVVTAMARVSTVLIGKTVGAGELKKVRSETRTLEVFGVTLGLVLGGLLFVLRTPLLSMYDLTPEALRLANRLLMVMSVVMVGMSYQMPVTMGIIRGGGDAKFGARLNIICTWLIVMPLAFMSAFWFKWSVVAVVICIQSDQIFKCLPGFIRVRRYDKWIKRLTK